MLTRRAQVWLLALFQVPSAFEPSLFPLSRLLSPSQIATPQEWSSLQKLAKQAGIQEKLLLSDYDGDGIRDFTLSQSRDTFILSAEDRDWDNDGKPNWDDLDVGSIRIVPSLPSQNQDPAASLSNDFQVEPDPKWADVAAKLAPYGVSLANDGADRIDSLVGVILEKVLNSLHWSLSPDFVALRATHSVAQKGKSVFFSWIASSGVVEFYPNALRDYIAEKSATLFKDAAQSEITQGYVIPLLVHSLAHEVGHAWRSRHRNIPKEWKPWIFESRLEKSKYLTSAREPSKVTQMKWERRNLRYRGQPPAVWLEKYSKVSSIPRPNVTADFLKQAGAPSVYALTDPEEWFAEQFALCLFRKIYPRATSEKESVRWSQLLGIRPDQVADRLGFNENCEASAGRQISTSAAGSTR